MKCRACPLWKQATQTVFGEGARQARIVLVGEQPGNREDLAGHPFVGPAGAILSRAMREAGIDAKRVYITNAVKHFKFERRGKLRLHKRPAEPEITACNPWLGRELALIKPAIVIALGATAARAVLGRKTPIGTSRGRIQHRPGGWDVLVTVHPSYLLRVPDTARQAEYRRFVADLGLATQAS